MSERKNIERFFQEKFKDLEVAPPTHLWDRIDNSLNQKKGRRNVIPLWWKIVGAAAVFTGLILTGSYILSPSTDFNNDINGVTNTKTNDSSSNNITTPSATENNAIVGSDSKQEDKENSINADSPNKASDLIKSKDIAPVAEQEIVDNTSNKTEDSDAQPSHKGNPSKVVEKDQSLAVVTEKEDALNTQKTVQQNDSLNLEDDNNTIIAKNEHTQLAESSNESVDSVAEGPTKKSFLEVVAEMEKAKEDALANVDQDKQDLRWSINPNVAPVYYNSLSQGSPLSKQFSENTKEGEISMSYGLNIAYQISERLSIRSGLNSVKMGYATDGIEFGPAISSASTQQLNVRFNNTKSSQASIALSDGQTPLYTPDNELQNRSENSYQGSINQKFGYLEIPMELKYRLLDKKFGVNLIGGFSSLFLTDNTVTIKSDNNLTSEVGEASNLNNTSFSTNIGVGMDYQVSDKLIFNLEPMFKYQMGTFSSDDGGFTPYMLGVYTGLSFKF